MLTADIITIFPDFFCGPLDFGIVKQAQKKGIFRVRLHDLRQYTADRHKTVDDRPFGGGEGMVLKPEPLFKSVQAILGELAPLAPRVVLLTPQGRPLDQNYAEQLAASGALILICGRYEGVDERVTRQLVTDEISVGDYVLSGGELAACLLIECVVRLLPGALNNSTSAHNESFRAGRTEGKVPLLDYPQFTRPEVFEDLKVPEVLLSGHHQKVALWRRKMSIEKTLKIRPDLLKYEGLSDEDKRLLATEFE